MKRKWILVVLWMLLIFYFSNQSGVESTQTSQVLITKLTFIKDIFGFSFELMTWIVRKCAHAFLYAVLGIFVYRAFGKKSIYYAMIICILYACFDEVHQLFIVGRSGNLMDVAIDTIGASVGVCLTYYWMLKRKIA